MGFKEVMEDFDRHIDKKNAELKEVFRDSTLGRLVGTAETEEPEEEVVDGSDIIEDEDDGEFTEEDY